MYKEREGWRTKDTEREVETDIQRQRDRDRKRERASECVFAFLSI